jgi:hypothetical protein
MVEPELVASPWPAAGAGAQDRVAALRRKHRARWLRGERVPVEEFARLWAEADATLHVERGAMTRGVSSRERARRDPATAASLWIHDNVAMFRNRQLCNLQRFYAGVAHTLRTGVPTHPTRQF